MPIKTQRPPILEDIGDRVDNRPPRQKHDRLDDDDKLLILHGTSFPNELTIERKLCAIDQRP